MIIPLLVGIGVGFMQTLSERYKCYGVNTNTEVTAAIEYAVQMFSYGANKDNLRDLLKETAIAESNYGNALYNPMRTFGRGIFQFDRIGMQQALQVATNKGALGKIQASDLYPFAIDLRHLDTVYIEFTQRAVLQAILCRFYYLGVKEAIPSTLEARAKYWKKYYNSELGAGTPEAYISRVKNFKE